MTTTPLTYDLFEDAPPLADPDSVSLDDASESNKASPELIDFFDEMQEDEIKDVSENQNHWTDVITAGGLRMVAGPVQALISELERAGKLPENSTVDFTNKVNQMETEHLVDPTTTEQIFRDLVAELIPISVETIVSRGKSIPATMGIAGTSGTVSGYLRYQENPDLVMSRVKRGTDALIGGGTGTVLAGMFPAVGRLIDSIRGSRSGIEVFGGSGADSVPKPEVTESMYETGREAVESGLQLTPATASGTPLSPTGDPKMLADEAANISKTGSEGERKLTDAAMSNREQVDVFLNELIKDIDSSVSDANGLYEAAKKMPPMIDVRAWVRSDPVLSESLDNMLKNKRYKLLWDQRPSDSEKFLLFRAWLQDTTEGGKYYPGPAQGEIAKENQKKVIELTKRMRKSNPVLDQAMILSQKNKIVEDLNRAIIDKVGNKTLDNINAYDVILGAVENPDIRRSVANMVDKKARKEALKRMAFLRKMLPALKQFENLANRTVQKTPDELAARGGAAPAAFYSVINAVGIRKSNKMVDFILNPGWSLREPSFPSFSDKLKGPLYDRQGKITAEGEELAKKLGIVLDSIVNQVAPGFFIDDTVYDKTAYSKDTSKQKRAWAKLEKSGNLDRFAQANPEAFEKLRRANTTRAMV